MHGKKFKNISTDDHDNFLAYNVAIETYDNMAIEWKFCQLSESSLPLKLKPPRKFTELLD